MINTCTNDCRCSRSFARRPIQEIFYDPSWQPEILLCDKHRWMVARQGNFSYRRCSPIVSDARQGCTSDVKDQFSRGDEHARGSGDLQELGRYGAFSPRNGVRVTVLDAPMVNAANPRAPLWREWTVCQDTGGLARSVC